MPRPERSGPTGNSMRQRRSQIRSQILRDKNEDERILGAIQKSVVNTQKSSHILKTFLVLITALICTVGALIRYNPKILLRFWRKPLPVFHLSTRYPPNVVIERDLPRFFRFYSIATPENEVARIAVEKVLRSRNQLRRRSGRIQTIVKAWDDSNIEQLLKQQICGDDFEVAYKSASQKRKDDLLMWCLITSRITEGYFKESLEMIDSPLFLTRNRGVVIKRHPREGVVDGYGALSSSFYLHPRINNNTAIDWIPSKILSMLISGPEVEGDVEGQELLERLLYDLVVTQGNENEYMILDEICQEEQPKRAIAFDSSNNADGCFLVIPEAYGGRFGPIEDD